MLRFVFKCGMGSLLPFGAIGGKTGPCFWYLVLSLRGQWWVHYGLTHNNDGRKTIYWKNSWTRWVLSFIRSVFKLQPWFQECWDPLQSFASNCVYRQQSVFRKCSRGLKSFHHSCVSQSDGLVHNEDASLIPNHDAITSYLSILKSLEWWEWFVTHYIFFG